MPPKITDSQRQAVLALLAQGLNRETVAAQVGVTPGQVSAVAAHVKMRTYEKHGARDTVAAFTQSDGRERVRELLEEIGVSSRRAHTASGLNRILIGVDAETNEEIFWNPDLSHGVANPHMLILGWCPSIACMKYARRAHARYTLLRHGTRSTSGVRHLPQSSGDGGLRSVWQSAEIAPRDVHPGRR